jgi:hypothetical protein
MEMHYADAGSVRSRSRVEESEREVMSFCLVIFSAGHCHTACFDISVLEAVRLLSD